MAIDLCSGAGGVTTGFKAAGVRVLAAVDNDLWARQTYKLNHPEVVVFDDDLLELKAADILIRTGMQAQEVDILTACVPCQTFSSLARGKLRKRDQRNLLVTRVGDFVDGLRPRAVVMENVPPLAGSIRFKALVRRLRTLGYGVWSGVVDAAIFGVPQRRQRLVLIGLRDKADEAVPSLTAGHPALRRFRERRTVRDALEEAAQAAPGDPLAEPKTNYPALVAARIRAIPPDGGSRMSLPPGLALSCHKGLGRSGAGNVYGRMQLDDVAPTLTTRCASPSCGRYLHPTADRAVTLREAACLQSFPVGYKFVGGTMSIQAQIGNAVPPRLAEAIATVVCSALAPGASRPVPAPDAPSSSTRARMQAVGKRDTPAERAVRSALHRLGLRFRVDAAPHRALRRRADIVFPRAKVAVFIDGCFWHGCPAHMTWPKRNEVWWRVKIEGVRRRDKQTDRLLRRAGWAVVRAWAHEDPGQVARRVAEVVVRRATPRT